MPGTGPVRTWPGEEYFLRSPGPLSQGAGVQEPVCGGPSDQVGAESSRPRCGAEAHTVSGHSFPALQGLLTTHLADE